MSSKRFERTLSAIRLHEWKITFMEQHAAISPDTPVGVWQGELTKVRALFR